MSDLELRVDGEVVEVAPGMTASWADRPRGIVRLDDGRRSRLVVVEGGGTDWQVTVAGRRVALTARSWRERVLAEAEVAAAAAGGPVEVRATLPGLVVAIHVEAGAEVVAGDSLLTIEAMKMQNEVRAPRDGSVVEIAVSSGQPVATGALLVRLS